MRVCVCVLGHQSKMYTTKQIQQSQVIFVLVGLTKPKMPQQWLSAAFVKSGFRFFAISSIYHGDLVRLKQSNLSNTEISDFKLKIAH